MFLIDLAASDGAEPWEDFIHLRKELEDYDPRVAQKPFLLVGNKIDEENGLENFSICKSKKFPEIEIIGISAILEQGLSELRGKFLESLY